MRQLLSACHHVMCRHSVYAMIGCLALIIGIGFASTHIALLYVFGGIGIIFLFIVLLYSPWYGVVLLAFFLPFERLGSYDIAQVTVRPSQIVALCTMLALPVYFLKKRTVQIPHNPIFIPLGCFFIAAILGVLHAPNIQRSFFVLLFIIFTCGISILLPFLILTKKQIEQLLFFLYISFGIVTIFGVYQFIGDWIGLPPAVTGLRELYTKEILGFPRVQSTALEPLYFANYLLVPLSILLSLFMGRVHFFKPSVFAVLIGLGVLNVVLTVARGGYIAFFVSACILLLYYFFQLQLFTWRNVGYAAAAGILGLIVLFQVVSFDKVIRQFTGHVSLSGILSGASYNERVEMFQVAENAWREHPIVGIGPGSFGPYEAEHPYIMPDHGWRIVNNEYIELLAENGLIGLLSLLVLFGIVILRSIKALLQTKDRFIHAVLLGVLAGFIGILIQYNTFSILYIVHIWFTIGLLIAIQNYILYPKHIHE